MVTAIRKVEGKPILLFLFLLALLSLVDSQLGHAQSPQLAQQIQQHYLKGSELLQRGDLQDAERELNQVTTLAPKLPEPYYLLAKVSIARGLVDGAEPLLLKAIQLKPDFAEAHHILGGIYLQRKDYARARDAFEKTLRWNPGYALAHVNLGATFVGLKQSTQAIKHFQTAIQLAPQASPTLFLASYELGSLYYAQRE